MRGAGFHVPEYKHKPAVFPQHLPGFRREKVILMIHKKILESRARNGRMYISGPEEEEDGKDEDSSWPMLECTVGIDACIVLL